MVPAPDLLARRLLVVTGKGEPHLEERMRALADRHKGAVGVRIGFDGEEARKM